MKSILLTIICAVTIGWVCNASAAAWGQQTTITGYFVYEGGSAYIRTANNQNPDSCGSTSYLYVDPSSARFKEIWSQILLAHTTGAVVSIMYSGCSPGNDYPKVGAIAVPNIW